jgi:hypothetical protein
MSPSVVFIQASRLAEMKALAHTLFYIQTKSNHTPICCGAGLVLAGAPPATITMPPEMLTNNLSLQPMLKLINVKRLDLPVHPPSHQHVYAPPTLQLHARHFGLEHT